MLVVFRGVLRERVLGFGAEHVMHAFAEGEQGTFHNALTTIEQQQLLAVEGEFQKELAKHRYYKVRRGDCLGKIARKYGISITRLKQLNGLKGNMIRPGQVLRCS